MPRRPRPATRRPPQSVNDASLEKLIKPTAALYVKPNGGAPKNSQADPESDSEASLQSDSGGFFEENSEVNSSGSSHAEEEIDAAPDAPRVAQWVDEEDLDVSSEDASHSDDQEKYNTSLKADLQSLSFGALRKAQRSLARADTDTDFEAETPSEEESQLDEAQDLPGFRLYKGKEREKGDSAPQKKEIPKRKHKHAPTEMSSKRPVSRSRFVVEEKIVPRDPRFVPVTGEYDAKRFHTQYTFLSDIHEEELHTLKDNLKRARKLLANSPPALREDREAEVERLERALKRAESAVNKDRREKVESEALSRAAQEERARRKEGKKAWYMKDGDKKALLLRAKYDALAATGGKGAVRKAIEKKQKKVNQKEKKKRPFVAGPSRGSQSGFAREAGPSRKRPRFENEDGSRKRHKSS